MNIRKIALFVSILMMALLSFGATAGSNHLEQAIQHAETAMTSVDGKTVAQHASEARVHAKSAKNDKSDSKHLDEGIKCLDDAVKEGTDGNTDAAKKAAKDAVEHFKQATK